MRTDSAREFIVRRGAFQKCQTPLLMCARGLAVLASLACWWSASHANAATDGVAQAIVEQSGVRRGVCAVVLSRTEDLLPIDIARASGLFIHVRCSDAATVTRLKDAARSARLGIDRMAIESGSTSRLPYADNLVDLVVIPNWSDGSPAIEEVLRVLRPRGIALLGGAAVSSLTGQANLRVAGSEPVTITGGHWLRVKKPRLEGAGDWTHWEHGPDNNPVSEDQVIKAPYLTQYLAHPFYIAMPSITTAAGGRTFLAIGHISHHEREWDTMFRLIASNGYNGTVLWERKLPEGYLVHRSAFIATDEAFYMIDGQRTLVLDPETGVERGEIRIPGMEGDWKWIVLKDGILYALAGPPDAPAEAVRGNRTFGGWSWADLSDGYYEQPHVPWGFGHTLAAYDLQTGKVLWKHAEEELIDSRGLSLGANRITLYCPGSHFRCLDLKTGEILWTNSDQKTLELIEQPGQKLTSTPGFRTMCMTLHTPDAIIVQGQTRNNVVALSSADGYLLWNKQKVTNNPNAIYLDGKVILGVGERGEHVAVDPHSGEIVDHLNFFKRACTRLTACSDSLFVRGEGTLRYDRASGEVMTDGAARPACNDGALPANGLLYIGPWQCDCNLSLIGRLARCSAGDFRFDYVATTEDRLQRSETLSPSSALPPSEADWPTYRGDNQRSASTSVEIPRRVQPAWKFTPTTRQAPTAPTSANGLVYIAGEDGVVKAIDGETGRPRWTFETNSSVKYPPTIAEGRAYFGSGDGYTYCVDAATGTELWRFRAAPIERHIMLYGHMASTWPVSSGVLVHNGVAYFAAGVIDSDGTYVYAVNAQTGELVWENHSSGHLNPELRKGVSVQGNLATDGKRLYLAGGNQVSPAIYELESGKCLAGELSQGEPKANNGRFVGMLAGTFPVVGGRILYSAAENVATKGSFEVLNRTGGRMTLNYGGIAPVWDDDAVTLVNFQDGQLTCLDRQKVATRIDAGFDTRVTDQPNRRFNGLPDVLAADGAVRWTTNLQESNRFEVDSIVSAPNAIVVSFQQQQRIRSQPQWYVAALDKHSGRPLWQHELSGIPLPDGLLVDRAGRVVVVLVNGDMQCFAAAD